MEGEGGEAGDDAIGGHGGGGGGGGGPQGVKGAVREREWGLRERGVKQRRQVL